MVTFIAGVLEQTEDGAMHEGVVYTRFLTIRHSSGQVLTIFDTAQPISTELRTGETYEMVIIPWNAKAVGSEPSSEPSQGPEDWQGKVVASRWQAVPGGFRHARPELFDHEWVLVATQVGQMLMRPTDISKSARSGDLLRWTNTRLDLYGVV